jgi:hypothetical protein
MLLFCCCYFACTFRLVRTVHHHRGHGSDTFTFYFARQRGKIDHGPDASKSEFKLSVLESEQTSTE